MQNQLNHKLPYHAAEKVAKGKTLVFAPHPDDEVFGCGGAIISHVRQGDEVKVVIVTDGGLTVNKEQENIEYTKIRKEESIKAAKILKYGKPTFLDYPDGNLINDGKLVSHLLEIISQFEPQNIYLPASTEIHPDHLALSIAVTEAASQYEPNLDLVYYEIGQMQSANLLFNITELHDQLDEAMECFKSQLEVQQYKYHINALHAYRTYTLGKAVKYAEAYFIINTKKLKKGSELWKQKKMTKSQLSNKFVNKLEGPLISVIVRTMNIPELANALDSISEQSYSNLEVIVVDALGSGVLNLGKKCGNFPLRVISKNKQLPRADAANVGLQVVNGEYFCFLDEDDLLLPNHIENLYELLKNSDSHAAYSNIKRVNNKNELLNIYAEDFNFSKLLWNNFIPIHALLIRTQPVRENCKFDDKLDVYEDWDFLIQISLIGNLLHSPLTTGIYIDTNASGVGKNDKKRNKYRTLLFEKWRHKLNNERYLDFLDYLASNSLGENDRIGYSDHNRLVSSRTKIDDLLVEKEDRINTQTLQISELLDQIEINDNLLAQQSDNISQSNSEKLELELELNIQKSVIQNLTNSISWRLTKPVRLIKNNKLIAKFLLNRNVKIIKNCDLYDEEYYLKHNADVRISGDDPLIHFVKYGGFESRNPGPNFDTNYYNKRNPDVLASGLNPLVHYVLFGIREKREIKDSGYDFHSDSISGITYESGDNNNLNFFSKVFAKFESRKEVQTISKSIFFNADYYLRANTDVKSTGLNPAKHYCFHGWKEGRNPSKEFNTNYYLRSNKDVSRMGINPLLHFITSGQSESRLPKAFEINEEECLIKADINEIELVSEINEINRVAVVFHLFHYDLIDEFINYFKNIPVSYDLIITTESNNTEKIRKTISTKLPSVKTNVITFENRGRDIAPFLFILKEYLKKYDLVCKVHTKKSGHDFNLKGWRKHLLDNLLGNSLIIKRIISEFNQNKQLGIVWPIAFPYLSYLGLDRNWGSESFAHKNFNLAKTYFPELNIVDSNETFDFPNGSMFWFRPEALNILSKKEISINDFGQEEQQIDGTLAHTLERLFGIIAKKSGFEINTVFFPQKLIKSDRNNYLKLTDSRSILFVAHDLFRAGAENLLLNLIYWLNKHTSFKISVLALKQGNDGGKLMPEYEKVANIYLWDEYCLRYEEEEAIMIIQEEIGHIDLIYGNTIVAAGIFDLLKIFNAPFITHIHELEESIQRYTSEKIRKVWKEYSSLYIACSNAVEENLIQNQNIPQTEIRCINEFIRPITVELPNKEFQRNIHGLSTEKTIIWGCGTIYWRKGTDIFIETAKALKDKGVENFIFYWIGGNYWDAESEEWGKWDSWEKFIVENDLSENIVFLDEQENPRDYFTSGDIFFLPSREDPFPLVCLEAAECGLPIVCFEDAGGMPEFVEKDAGKIVPFLDINAAANALEELIVNEIERTEKGKNARTKLFQRHTVDIAAPKILQICHSVMHSNPLVSVIVLVYNHEDFLKERIESILNQSFRDFEINILDDASTDNSYEIAKSYEWHPAVQVIRNENNSGSPFKQWEKGVKLAKGKFIWIAEGDDKSDTDFLETLLPAFNDTEVSLAFCASHRINEVGEVYDNHYLNIGHYDNLNYPKSRWDSKYISQGVDEVINALAIRNTIPNASAVMFKGDALKEINFEQCATFKNAGDWYAYISILKKGSISYNSAHLNYHRVHSNSVVAQSKREASETIPDYFEIHKLIIQDFTIAEEVLSLMIQSVTDGLRTIWPDLNDKEFKTLYNVEIINHLYGKK